LQNPVERDTRIRERRSRTLSRLLRAGMAAAEIQALWDTLPQHAVIRLSANQLEWATGMVVEAGLQTDVIEVRSVRPHGISEVLVYVPDKDGLFAAITSVFDEMRLNVLSARILTTDNARSFDLFQLMDRDGDALIAADVATLKRRLARACSGGGGYSPVRRSMPRRLKHFKGKPSIRLSRAPRRQGTLMELECNDRPGLLSRIASAMAEQGVQVHDARIATFGERVEDTFLISDGAHQPLDEKAGEALVHAIEDKLDH
jgi:[protein-PII] uridylyltransferase